MQSVATILYNATMPPHIANLNLNVQIYLHMGKDTVCGGYSDKAHLAKAQSIA